MKRFIYDENEREGRTKPDERVLLIDHEGVTEIEDEVEESLTQNLDVEDKESIKEIRV